jgi:hypothetical protein
MSWICATCLGSGSCDISSCPRCNATGRSEHMVYGLMSDMDRVEAAITRLVEGDGNGSQEGEEESAQEKGSEEEGVQEGHHEGEG